MEKLIISACLLGAATRYDGKSKASISEEDIRRLCKRYHLIPVCPEIYGGLPTPRTPSERVGEKVVMKNGDDVTENYIKGAYETLSLCRLMNVKKALLKAKSPSCSKSEIYDGNFKGKLVFGKGVTAELLEKNGIEIFDENDFKLLLN